MATLLIKNVRLIDGVHDFPEKSDVFVTQDRISAIGNFPNKSVDATIDGQGAWLAPGFIDVDTSSDHYLTLLAYPSQADFLKQGVTTAFGGTCGSSLAPLLYGDLSAIEKWGSAAKLNVGWHTVADFLGMLDRHPLGVNFGTLAGHLTVRRDIVGDELRDLTKNEQAVFEKTIGQALDEGAFGVSTGLGYVHGRSTSLAELKWIAGMVKAANGVYATHLRDIAGGIDTSIGEALKVADVSGARTLVSHLIPFADAVKDYEKALAAIDSLPADREFRFDISPSDSAMRPFHAFLPVWAQGDVRTMARNVKDEWLVGRIVKEMPVFDASQFTVVRAPGHEFLVGKRLTDVMETYGTDDSRVAFIRLMAATGARGTALYRDLDTGMIRRAIASPRSFVASDAPSFGGSDPGVIFRSERTTSTFTTFLKWVEEDNLMPLADAVRKISYEPARFFRLKDRGELREGAIADLACFKNGEVKATVVGGKVAMKDGEFREVFAGKALRRK